MSDERTPTTDEVRHGFAWSAYHRRLSMDRAAEFDRWLAEHDREIAAKARTDILEEIEWLMNARNEYTDERVNEHMDVVKHLLRVLHDHPYSADGWLPSWRWDEWAKRRDADS